MTEKIEVTEIKKQRHSWREIKGAYLIRPK